MRRWVGVLGLGLVLLVGCGSARWVHATKTEQQFHEDTAFCQAQAGQATPQRDPFGAHRSRVYGSCMRGKGWALATRR